MRTLFIGGIKSGKSFHAQEYILENSTSRPLYLATNEFFDAEMHTRVQEHKIQRKETFITQEEPLYIAQVITNSHTPVLIECVSMWINNMLYHKHNKQEILHQIKTIVSLNKEMVFVINDVSCSVVSEHKLVREFVDINGQVAQIIASQCDAVYNVVAGIRVQIK